MEMLCGHRWAGPLVRDRHGKRTVLGKACASAVPMASLFAFYFLLITVFAIIAMMLFGRQLNFPSGTPRQNFNSFPRAWMTIFQVTSGDTWMDVTWEAMRTTWVRSGFCQNSQLPKFCCML